jgi:Mg-chelatase subunit ChlD
MKLSYWLAIALAGALGCGSSDTSTSSDHVVGDQDDDDQGSDDDQGPATTKAPSKDAGGAKDAGSTKGASSPASPGSTNGAGQGSADQPCYSQPIRITPNSPDILIVLDRSGSMVTGVDRWGPSVRAVNGLASALTETVAFGLMVFPAIGDGGGPGGGAGFDWTVFIDPTTYTDPTKLADPNTYIQLSCDPGQVDIPVDLNTADEIATFLNGATPNPNGATPTSASLAAALTALSENCSDCIDREKYVVLVTDGAPTCGAAGITTTPEDISAANTAIDNLLAAKIKTYVVGYATSSDPVASDAMDQFAQHGGTEHHFPVEDEATLVTELTRIAGALVPCEFDLNQPVDDPKLLSVEIDQKGYAQDIDWTYDAANNKIVLHTDGEACPLLRDAKVHKLDITRECEPPILL